MDIEKKMIVHHSPDLDNKETKELKDDDYIRYLDLIKTGEDIAKKLENKDRRRHCKKIRK